MTNLPVFLLLIVLLFRSRWLPETQIAGGCPDVNRTLAFWQDPAIVRALEIDPPRARCKPILQISSLYSTELMVPT